MAIQIIEASVAQSVINQKSTRGRTSPRKTWFVDECLPYLADNANGETLAFDLLAATVGDGDDLIVGDGDAGSLYSTFTKLVKENVPADHIAFKHLKIVKRIPSDGEGLTVDTDGNCAMLYYVV